MFPFWQDVVAPLVEAATSRRIVEIGALRGENTELMLRRLGRDVELHVIDPVPDFDPTEHERRFPGRYIFHRDLSLNVLGELPPMDVALIDGDHNYYTVRNELRILAEVSDEAGVPMPVMVLHDVGWPYGRRDLYYDPENIPDEHRQEWRRTGMLPGKTELVPYGRGLNATLANAVLEGGPRNGVMTAVEDFIAECGRSTRLVMVPTYFGLAIVVDEERLARQPAVKDHLDRLETVEGKDMLLHLAEKTRIDAAVMEQAMLRQRNERLERLTSGYLETTKSAILNDHHVEIEARYHHLLDSLARDSEPSAAVLRDPQRNARGSIERLKQEHRRGEAPPPQRPTSEWSLEIEEHRRQGFATTGRAGLDFLHRSLDDLFASSTSGDIAMCGFGFGGPAVLVAAYLRTYDDGLPRDQRALWCMDRFRPSDGFADLNQARETLDRFDLLDERVKFLQGDVAATLGDVAEHLALLHIGEARPADVRTALEHLHPRVVEGGIVVVEHGAEPSVREAVAEFRAGAGLHAPLETVGPGILHWRKPHPVESSGASPATVEGASRSPLAPRAGMRALDLSVVLVVHNMRREAERTLHALSRRYQEGVEDLEYEVLVLENGSDPGQRLGDGFVSRFGREFRYLDLGADAAPSPVHALNRGIASARGRNLALMIDGAHVLTPRVLHYGMAGLDTYEPAIVATQPWYVGPGQQGEAMRFGYDQPFEDTLFDQIAWPDDGYRLFDVGHFVGDRDWFDGLWESNCLFTPRSLLEQVGGFDEAFAMAGGGYANLDLYERLTSSPGVRVVSIIGEGSFHQLHGGTTTNLTDPLERRQRVRSYNDHFVEQRGRPFMGPEKTIHYVGGFHSEAAMRSRSRRMTASTFEVNEDLEGLDGPATDKPVPVADDLKSGFTNAYYRSLAWKRTKWLGHNVANAVTDLVTYQEIMHEVRPDWIIDTCTGNGGRAHFMASICDLLGHGQVLTIDPKPREDRLSHPRVTHVAGRADKPDVIECVRETVGDEPHALVILGTRGPRQRTRKEFDAYSPMVRVGSYVVVEHTVLNGFPIDASSGPGPHEAVRRILNLHGDFLSDTEREKHSLTFNAGGFLRRIS